MTMNTFQSHYVPEDKPYAVYTFTQEGPYTEIAQRIATLLVGNQTADGNITFTQKAVYRIVREHMLSYMHTFVEGDTNSIVDDEEFLGHIGDAITNDMVAQVKFADEFNAEGGLPLQTIISRLHMAGMTGTVTPYKHASLQGRLAHVYDEDDIKSAYLMVVSKIPLRLFLSRKNISEKPYRVLPKLWDTISQWSEVDITFNNIRMDEDSSHYQQKVDELLALARLFGKYASDADESLLYSRELLRCCHPIMKDNSPHIPCQCTVDDIRKMAGKRYISDIDKLLSWSKTKKLLTIDGHTVTFSDDLMRMLSWQW